MLAVVLISDDDSPRDVADGVVEALGDTDPDAYESLFCAGVTDPVSKVPPVAGSWTRSYC